MTARGTPARKFGPERNAWDPVDLELAEVADIKAMAAAHPRGFAAIVDKLCGFGGGSFIAGGEDGRRQSDYAEGKRAIAISLRAVLAMKLPTVGRGAPPRDLPNSETPKPAARAGSEERAPEGTRPE